MDKREDMEQRKQELILKLSKDVRRGNAAQAFLESDFFRLYLQGFLSEREVGIGRGATWSPESGVSRIEAVALGCAHAGGRLKELNRWKLEIQTWILKGRKAQERLNRLEAKK